MAKEMLNMNDEELNQVTGGTILPYRIKSGDSLEKIAEQYHVTVDQLLKWNDIHEGDVLTVGQLLKIKF